MSVVMGVLRDANHVETERGEVLPVEFEGRAAWSWLRLQHGRAIDDEIKAALDEAERRAPEGAHKGTVKGLRERAMMAFLESAIPSTQRTVQFIVDDTEKLVKAVASTRHLLIPPGEVEATANEILTQRAISFQVDPDLEGLVSMNKEEVAGLYVGFHVHPGDILTRRAISVSSYTYTLVCTNPLSWAGVGGFGRFGLRNLGEHERILRIERRIELRPRLEQAIDQAGQMMDKLRSMVQHAQENQVDPREARTILYAFSKAYGIGDKVIEELLGRLGREPSTTFGMSQAASYVARHGEAYRETPEGQTPRARASMATIGAASLTIEDPRLTYEKVKKWLGGQALPDYLEEL